VIDEAVAAALAPDFDAVVALDSDFDAGVAPARSFDAAKPFAQDPLDVIATLRRAEAVPWGCFARSTLRRAIACHVGDYSIQGGGDRALVVLGDDWSRFSYVEREPHSFDEPAPEEVDQAVLDRAAEALRAGGYRGWAPGGGVELVPGEQVAVGDAILRRAREVSGKDGHPRTGVWDLHRDRVELRCGRGWVELPLEEPFSNDIAPARITVHAIDANLLLTGEVRWTIEGDFGDEYDAALIDPAARCETPSVQPDGVGRR
jgi:hypothetical protein